VCKCVVRVGGTTQKLWNAYVVFLFYPVPLPFLSRLSSSLFCFFFALLYRLFIHKSRMWWWEDPKTGTACLLCLPLSLGWPFLVLSPPCWLKFFGNAQSPKIAGSAKGKWLSFRDWFLAMDARMFVNDVQYTSDVRVNVYIPGKRKLKLCQSWKTKSESDCADTISRSRVWSSQFSSRPMTYCVCVGPGTKDALLRGRSGMADGRCSR
jgi:hypothetical protein